MHFVRLILLALGLLAGLAAHAEDLRPGCDSCRIRIDALDQPVKLAGQWLFTRDDAPRNKDVGIDTRSWRLAKAPGPWKKIYDDRKNFTVGWYRGEFEFAPSLVGQEVVLLVNTYMARMQVWVDGQPVYARPHDITTERYYSVQPVPVRFKVTQTHLTFALRVDTPLMAGVYSLPFELHKYGPSDTSLVVHQVWGGEVRNVVAYVTLTFGLFFLLVYAKTRYSLYLVAAAAGITGFPFFVMPGDYLLKLFEPETLLYLHYVGLGAVSLFYIFSQYFHRFTPRLNWILGGVHGAMALGIGAMAFHPDLDLFQHLRSLVFVVALVIGGMSLYMLARGAMARKPHARILLTTQVIFMLAAFNDALLALGAISSVALVFSGVTIHMGAMLYVACQSFASTFSDNKQLLKEVKAVNDNLEHLVAERTTQLREKTQDIHSMLQNMPQGVLTVTAGNRVHPEYSAYLETILETAEIAGRDLMGLLFRRSTLGADTLSQVEVAAGACIGEDRMNFDFNAHLLLEECELPLPGGRLKSLALSWSPICDGNDVVDKLMLCVRDVTEIKRLSREAGQQKRELALIGEILAVSQEKFHEFVDGARQFIADNRRLIDAAGERQPQTLALLFRNMHTIKGNARTYGLLALTNAVHEAEQDYDALRKDDHAAWLPQALLSRLDAVQALLDEYARINDVVLGRQGAGRRGSVDRFLMVEKDQVASALHRLADVDHGDAAAMRRVLDEIGRTLHLAGTETLAATLAGALQSLPSLAQELGKLPPEVRIVDHGILVRNQVSGLLKNLFNHLLRNAVDHGLEPADERLAASKPAAGTITIELAVDNGQMQLRLTDDGRGIAMAKIRQRAIERGLIAADAACSDEEVAQFIFLSGFSTAERVTEVSGRGVGMDAVRGFLQNEDGQIALRFVDRPVADGYRGFELLIGLPDRCAASLDAAMSFDALRAGWQAAKSADSAALPGADR